MAAATTRPTQMQRFRQRFMHKLVYFPANNDGMYSCVGCETLFRLGGRETVRRAAHVVQNGFGIFAIESQRKPSFENIYAMNTL